MPRIPQAVQQVSPRSDVETLCRYQAKFFDNQFVEFVVDQREWDFVDRKILVLFFDDSFCRDIAEQSNFFSIVPADGMFTTTNQHIRLNTNRPKLAH